MRKHLMIDDDTAVSEYVTQVIQEKIGQIDELRSQKADLENEVIKRTAEIRQLEQIVGALLNIPHESAVLLDQEGRILAVNAAGTRLIGCRQDSLSSKNFFDFLPTKISEKILELLKDVISTGRDARFKEKRKGVFLVHHIYPVKDDAGTVSQIAVYSKDITARVNAERALKKSESKYRNIIESMEEGYYEMDLDGRFTFINDSICQMLGSARKEIKGRSYRKYINEGSALQIQEFLTSISMTGKSIARVEFELTRRDGSIVRAETSISPVRSREGIVGFRGMVRDVTERKKAEENLKEAQNQLETANIELVTAYSELKSTQSKMLQSEKMASIGQLAAGVAHEINNPVGFVTSNLGTLKKYIDKIIEYNSVVSGKISNLEDPDIHEQIEAERIRSKIDYIMDDMGELIDESLEGTARVKKIVHDLKSFSRIDEDECKVADINECIESTLNIVWNELKYKVDVHKEYGEIPMIRCYPQQLNQVFMNLLINAGQAIEERGEISIRTWWDERAVRISIADTGCGIPKDKVSRIFEPFFTTKEVGKGTGLGLSIVYDIVKKHQGDIDVQSEVGKGTTFDVSIPAVQERGK